MKFPFCDFLETDHELLRIVIDHKLSLERTPECAVRIRTSDNRSLCLIVESTLPGYSSVNVRMQLKDRALLLAIMDAEEEFTGDAQVTYKLAHAHKGSAVQPARAPTGARF